MSQNSETSAHADFPGTGLRPQAPGMSLAPNAVALERFRIHRDDRSSTCLESTTKAALLITLFQCLGPRVRPPGMCENYLQFLLLSFPRPARFTIRVRPTHPKLVQLNSAETSYPAARLRTAMSATESRTALTSGRLCSPRASH